LPLLEDAFLDFLDFLLFLLFFAFFDFRLDELDDDDEDELESSTLPSKIARTSSLFSAPGAAATLPATPLADNVSRLVLVLTTLFDVASTQTR